MDFDPSAAAQPGSGVFGLPHGAEDARVVLVPVPFEATVSYRSGTARGPAAVLEASRQVDLFDVHNGDFWREGIHMLPEDPSVRRWNREARAAAAAVIRRGGAATARTRTGAARVDALGARLNGWLAGSVAEHLDRGRIVGVVGGDHSVPFASIAEHAARHRDLSLLHVDAHADLRVAYEGFAWSHASIMDNVMEKVPGVRRLVQVGLRDLSREELERIRGSRGRIQAFLDDDLARHHQAGRPFAAMARRVAESLTGEVYVSFDIDGLDPALCPHTGTPVPGGLSFREAVALLEAVVTSGRRIVGFDLCEVAPGPRGDT